MKTNLNTSDLQHVLKYLQLMESVNIGNLSDLIFQLPWVNMSDDDVFAAVAHLDEAHKIMVKRPASLMRPSSSTEDGKVIAELMLKIKKDLRP